MVCVLKGNCWFIYILVSNSLFLFLNICNLVSKLSNLIIYLVPVSISFYTSSVSYTNSNIF